jgi:chromate transporter
VVEVHQLLTNAQFAELYTLAQVAPGPNAMYVTLIGWHLADWKGIAATTIPLLVPATTLTLLVGHLNERHPQRPDRPRYPPRSRRSITPAQKALRGWTAAVR